MVNNPDLPTNRSGAFVKVLNVPPYQSGILSELTFGVKDLIDIAHNKTGGGNPTWEKTHPEAQVHAICVEQLLLAGAHCTGKTITDELAYSLLGENYFYGTPLNPQAPLRVPGGSSSGSASAVACGEVDFAIGTDTGGSVRVPASNCGVFGFRPSHGRISVAGVIPFAPSFDTVAVFAKNANIMTKVAEVLLGTALKTSEAKNVFILKDALSISDLDVQEAFETSLKYIDGIYSCKMITLHEIFKEHFTFEIIRDIFSILQRAEIWNSFGSWIEETHPEFGPRTSANFMLAKQSDRSKILHSNQLRMQFKDTFNHFLGDNALLCIPTTPSIAPKKNSQPIDRTAGTYFPRVSSLTSLAGLASSPQISLPLASSSDGTPIGLSLLASSGNDELLMQTILTIVNSF